MSRIRLAPSELRYVMIDMTFQEIKSEVEGLCDADKGKLATDLLSMMKPSDYWVTDEEVLERVKGLWRRHPVAKPMVASGGIFQEKNSVTRRNFVPLKSQ